MYGKSPVEFPQRIVCLTAETTEIAFMVGAGDRVVGVPGTARRPETARQRARVGGFTTFRTDRILALEPDLVLGFSDLQRDIVAELIGGWWCGKPVDAAAIAGRPAWDTVAAVAAGEIHEIAGEDVLSPGPSLVHGLRRIHEIIQAFQAR